MSQFTENKKRAFSDHLKALVKGWENANKQKLTQEKLGDALFVSRETVSGWFNCKSLPSEDTIKRICNFFNVPEWYFSRNNYDKGQTEINEQTHDDLESTCEETAERIGLSQSLVAFIKENPILADAVVSASWVDAYLQSLSPSVPVMPDKLFQFVSSSNVKVYPSTEVLYMLRVVQRDLTEYAGFLIQKWSNIIKEAHDDEKGKEITIGTYGSRTENGKEIASATERFSLEMRGRSSLTPGASLLVDMYNGMTGHEQQKLISDTQDAFRESRKKNPQAQKIRKAVRKAMNDGTPVPPLDETLKEKGTEKSE